MHAAAIRGAQLQVSRQDVQRPNARRILFDGLEPGQTTRYHSVRVGQRHAASICGPAPHLSGSSKLQSRTMVPSADKLQYVLQRSIDFHSIAVNDEVELAAHGTFALPNEGECPRTHMLVPPPDPEHHPVGERMPVGCKSAKWVGKAWSPPYPDPAQLTRS